MDDYQKHLERQLQQQQQQLRNQANELGTTRNLGPPFLQQQQQQQQQQHQQRIQPPPPQWTLNNIPGQTAQTGNPGFGRGGPPVVGNPMAGMVGLQQQTQQPGQPLPNAYSSSPQQHVPNLQSTPQVPVQKNQGSPAPGSPHQGDDHAEKMRIVTLLEVNSRLIKICESLRSTVPPQNLQTDPTHTGCLLRLQQNLAYLAAIADRANKADSAKRQLPILTLLSSPPMIRIVEEKDALDKLYSALSSLQANVDTTNGDNASGSESGSQVNSPQVRSRQTSAGSSGIPGPQGQHAPTPTMQRSQLPGHNQQHTPSPHMLPSQIHGQSGLNPNASQGNIRPQQPQQQPFPQNFPQAQQFQSQTSAPQYQQQLAQHPQFSQQTQNPQFSPQNTNQQFPQQLNQNQMFQQQQQQNQTQQQFQQFQQQSQNQQLPQPPQSFQPQPHLQPRAPSRPPSRPGSQHSLTTQSHQPSPTISPRPGHQPQPGPSPQLTSTPNPSNPSSRIGMSSLPADLTPEQTALLQERMRLAREARIHQIQQAQQQAQQAQQAGRPTNMFSMQNGVGMQNQNIPNGFGSFPSGAMMNGMSSTSAPTQNQNFGAGGTGGE